MNIAQSYKKTTAFILLFKVMIVLGIIWLVHEKLWIPNKEIGYLDHIKSVVKDGSLFYLGTCIFLAPINWLFESKKWKLLVSPFQQLAWKETAEAIMSGITLGVLTPSRLGEYGGRLLHIKEGNRGKALYAHFIGSLSQNIPILIFGAISSAVFFSHHFLKSELLAISFAFILLCFSALLIMLYLQNTSITDKIINQKYFKKITKDFIPTQYENSVLSQVAILSLFRYIIYVSQYLLLLYYFDIHVGISEAMMGVAIIFLFQTGMPLPPALSVVVRAELAIIIWSIYDTNQMSILTVPVLLWMINLLVPAIIGSIILVTSNLQKQVYNV